MGKFLAGRRLSLSVRALMVFVLVAGGGLGLWIKRVNAQRHAIETIHRFSGSVEYDFEYGRPPDEPMSKVQQWLWDHDLVDCFHSVVSVRLQAPIGPGLKSVETPEDEETLWSSLDELRGLKSLRVDALCVTPIALDHLERKVTLEHLVLIDNEINDAELRRLTRLVNLRSLTLSSIYDNSPSSDSGIAHLANLPQLRELVLRSRSMTDGGLLAIGRMHQLQVLVLYYPAGTGQGLAHLKGLGELRELTLVAKADGKLSLTDASAEPLSGLVKLQRLYLGASSGRNDISDRGLSLLGKLKNLQTLHLRDAKITDAGLSAIGHLTELEDLDLSGAAIGDQGLAHLHSLTKLRELTVNSTNISEQGVARMKQALPGVSVHWNETPGMMF